MTKEDSEIIELVQQCLDREYSVEIVRCGQFSKPGQPYLCRVSSGYGTALREHLVYGNDAPKIMVKAMKHVLTHGFTQNQDRYGLRGSNDHPPQ